MTTEVMRFKFVRLMSHGLGPSIYNRVVLVNRDGNKSVYLNGFMIPRYMYSKDYDRLLAALGQEVSRHRYVI